MKAGEHNMPPVRARGGKGSGRHCWDRAGETEYYSSPDNFYQSNSSTEEQLRLLNKHGYRETKLVMGSQTQSNRGVDVLIRSKLIMSNVQICQQPI